MIFIAELHCHILFNELSHQLCFDELWLHSPTEIVLRKLRLHAGKKVPVQMALVCDMIKKA